MDTVQNQLADGSRYAKPGCWRASKPAGDFPRRASPISKSPLGASRVFSEPSRRPTAARSSHPPPTPGADTPPLGGRFALRPYSSLFMFLPVSSDDPGGAQDVGQGYRVRGLSCLLRPRLAAAYIALHGSGRLDRLDGCWSHHGTGHWTGIRITASHLHLHSALEG